MGRSYVMPSRSKRSLPCSRESSIVLTTELPFTKRKPPTQGNSMFVHRRVRTEDANLTPCSGEYHPGRFGSPPRLIDARDFAVSIGTIEKIQARLWAMNRS